jgi:vacuolar-type H+-ATPase subunit I/STV1
MGTPLIRAMNTIDLLHAELTREREKRLAMDMCFAKIHKALDMYQGHFINRIRFHMNKHHSVYVRRVRAMQKQEEKAKTAKGARRSARVESNDDLTKEVKRLRALVDAKDREIESLCQRIDRDPKAVEALVGRKKISPHDDLATSSDSDTP